MHRSMYIDIDIDRCTWMPTKPCLRFIFIYWHFSDKIDFFNNNPKIYVLSLLLICDNDNEAVKFYR